MTPQELTQSIIDKAIEKGSAANNARFTIEVDLATFTHDDVLYLMTELGNSARLLEAGLQFASATNEGCTFTRLQ